MAKRSGFQFKDIHGFVQSLFGEDMHAKRVYSLANATLGVLASGSLAIHLIGQGLAQGRGLEVPLGRGSADFPQLLGILEEHQYRGYLTVVREQAEQPAVEIDQAMEFLRSLTR